MVSNSLHSVWKRILQFLVNLVGTARPSKATKIHANREAQTLDRTLMQGSGRHRGHCVCRTV